jgi:(R,R)-butanediol dehydrogenase/meso-butanediol dehydrogenase/diacetyl reductase
MKAAVFREVGKKLSIEEVPEPEPGDRDLVVEVRACGICGSDLHVSELSGALPAGAIMGHEFAGEVVEVGAEARADFEVGDRVCPLPYISCGRCAACLTGNGGHCPDIQAIGLGQLPGAYAERIRVGARQTLHLPDAVSMREGALVEPLSVGLHAVAQVKLEPGAGVLVLGAGPIGLSTALWARFFGARTVAVSEKVAARLELAEKFGATHLIDASRQDVAAAFEEAAGRQPDVIFECVGVPGMLQQCITLAPMKGRVVVAGVCMQSDILVPVLAVLKEISFHFVLGYSRQEFQLTIDMLGRDRIRGEPMLTDSIGLAELPEAFEALKRPTSQCKVILEL